MQTQFTIPRAAVRALLTLAASQTFANTAADGQTSPKGDCLVCLLASVSAVSARCLLVCLFVSARAEEAGSWSESIGAKGFPALIVRARDDGRYDLCDLANDTSRTFAAVEGKFPDWRRVMPRDSGEVMDQSKPFADLPFAQFDPAYVQAFAKAAKAFGCKYGSSLKIGHRGQSAACVEISGAPGFFGVLMPLRTDRADVPRMAPAWALEPMPAANPVALVADPATDASANDSSAADAQAAA
jgi:hypothetical protein